MNRKTFNIEAIPSGTYSEKDLEWISKVAQRRLQELRLRGMPRAKLEEILALEIARTEFLSYKVKNRNLTAGDIESLAVRAIHSLVPFVADYTAASVSKQNKQRSKHAADVRHNQSGGSRDKQAQIRAIWASGKYTSKDICAEQECASLNMAFSTARKALRNIPKPQKST